MRLETDKTKRELAFLNIQLRNRLREIESELAQVKAQNAALWIQINKTRQGYGN